MKKFDIISYHPGRQHNLEQAYQISRHFQNFKHITSLYFDRHTVERWQSFLPKIGAALKKRSGDIAGNLVDMHAAEEIKLLIKTGIGYRNTIPDYINRNRLFQQWIYKKYSPPAVVVGFDTSSSVLFKKWKGKSHLVLDLTIAIPQYKLTLAKRSNMDTTVLEGLTKGDHQLYDIHAEEVMLADTILCGSGFVKDSCLSICSDADKMVVLPYGADTKKFNGSRQTSGNSVRVVFVGTVNYRKGADIAMQAWQMIGKKYPEASLHFYGGVEMDTAAAGQNIFFHGFIPQQALVEEMRLASISILPTFFEGSSLAIYQSMAMGLAVITTPNAGSIIEDNRNGLLIPYGSVDALINALELLLQNRSELDRLANNAVSDVQSYTWAAYGDKLANMLTDRIRNVDPTAKSLLSTLNAAG